MKRLSCAVVIALSVGILFVLIFNLFSGGTRHEHRLVGSSPYDTDLTEEAVVIGVDPRDVVPFGI
jgi:hypothetical protein